MRAAQTTVVLLAGLGLLGSGPAAAQSGSLSYSSTLETWGYYTRQQLEADSIVNPHNRIGAIPTDYLVTDLRLNLRVAAENASLIVQPRFYGTTRYPASDSTNGADASFLQLFGRINLGPDSVLTGGRQLMAWGPASFRSPSTPFYFDSGKLNPLREQSGIDLLRLEHWIDGIGLSAGYVFDTGRVDATDMDRAGFIKLDYQGADYLVSVNLVKAEDYRPFYGAYGQLNANDATLVYLEYGYGQRAGQWRMDPAASTGIRRVSSSDSESVVLLGMAYTELDGSVVSLEYLHNGHGLSGSGKDHYVSAMQLAARRAFADPDPRIRGESQALLGQALQYSSALLGRHYVSLVWQSSPLESDSYWRVASAINVRDRSNQITAYYERNISPRVTLFANGVYNVGAHDSEYRMINRSVFSMGAKFFLL